MYYSFTLETDCSLSSPYLFMTSSSQHVMRINILVRSGIRLFKNQMPVKFMYIKCSEYRFKRFLMVISRLHGLKLSRLHYMYMSLVPFKRTVFYMLETR